MTEMEKLEQGLIERGIDYTKRALHGGQQIIVEDMNWDAVCHEFSYGHERGLIEIMGSIVDNDDDDVEGWLTAEEILARIDGEDDYEEEEDEEEEEEEEDEEENLTYLDEMPYEELLKLADAVQKEKEKRRNLKRATKALNEWCQEYIGEGGIGFGIICGEGSPISIGADHMQAYMDTEDGILVIQID